MVAVNLRLVIVGVSSLLQLLLGTLILYGSLKICARPLNSIMMYYNFIISYDKICKEYVAHYLWQEIVNNWGCTMRVTNPEFTWEKQNQWNIGMDLTTLQNRLNVTAEIYHKHSYDLIYDS